MRTTALGEQERQLAGDTLPGGECMMETHREVPSPSCLLQPEGPEMDARRAT